MDLCEQSNVSAFRQYEIEGIVLVCLVTKLCPSLCDPMYYSLPGSSVHEISQERILEWVAISFSRVDGQVLLEYNFITKTNSRQYLVHRLSFADPQYKESKRKSSIEIEKYLKDI